MNIVKIGSKCVGSNQPVFFIAEIGINHNGDLAIAKKLIDIAIESGCDAVKFQKRTVEVVYSEEELARPRESPFGKTNGDLKRGLEFGQKEYEEIDRYCRKKNIMWFASSWDEASVDFIEQFDPPCYKIASASITDTDLLEHVADKGKAIIMSTGMSDHKIIRDAIKALEGVDLVLMHTVSTYPAKLEELNLSAIQTMVRTYDLPTGYSGHEVGLFPSLCAAVLGACVIERHITLDRSMWGTDQSASVEPHGLKKLIEEIRDWETARGNGVKSILDSEIPVMKKLRRVQ
ncbi:MAG: N-acetylneuraminate synthase family protein [Nanoarchaeota archaeon]